MNKPLPDSLPTGIPTWQQLINQFGPYLGTLMFFIIIIVVLQWYWYKKNLESKNQEIERCVKRISELETHQLKLISQLRSSTKK